MLRCRLCGTEQTKTKCELVKDSVLEIVEALCIPAKVLTGPDAAICEVCSERLHTLFLFKSKCIWVEDILYPYYSIGETVEISLRDIFKKNKENHGEDVEICRLCLSTTKQSLLLFNLCTKHDYQSVFDVHLPELDLKFTKHCHICSTCIQNLDKFAKLTKCIATTQELMMSEDTIPEGNIPKATNQINELIKKETIDELKMEDELTNNIIDVTTRPDSQSTNGPSHDSLIRKYLTSTNSSKFYFNHPAVPQQVKQKPLLVSNKENTLPAKLNNTIKCNICFMQFANNYNLNRHCRKQHSKHLVSCSQCDYKASTGAHIEIHFKRMHRDNKPLNCYKCLEKFASFSNLLRHLKTTHKETLEGYELCNRCGFKADTTSDLKNHKTFHSCVPATIKCSLCPKVYRKQDSLRTHFLKHHTDTKKLEKFECFICGFKTPFKIKLRYHIQQHLQKNSSTDYKCDSCTFTTLSVNSLYAHKRTKHGTDSFKCKLCEFTAKVKHSLKKHYDNMHKDISEVKLFTCNVCSFQTKYSVSFANHQLLHKDPSTVKKYHCAHCSFKTIYRHKISHHLKKQHIVSSKTGDFTSISTDAKLTEDSSKKSSSNFNQRQDN